MALKNNFPPAGIFAPEVDFLAPRYILCLPERTILVLDNKALYVIKPSGRLVCKLFEGEAERFRGLGYYKGFGRVVTTERKSDGSTQILFIDVVNKKDIVHRFVLLVIIRTLKIQLDSCFGSIPIGPTTAEPDSKIRFVTVRGRKVFASDLGMGRLYITDLRTEETKVVKSFHNGTNRLKSAMGIAVDPAGK